VGVQPTPPAEAAPAQAGSEIAKPTVGPPEVAAEAPVRVEREIPDLRDVGDWAKAMLGTETGKPFSAYAYRAEMAGRRDPARGTWYGHSAVALDMASIVGEEAARPVPNGVAVPIRKDRIVLSNPLVVTGRGYAMQWVSEQARLRGNERDAKAAQRLIDRLSEGKWQALGFTLPGEEKVSPQQTMMFPVQERLLKKYAQQAGYDGVIFQAAEELVVYEAPPAAAKAKPPVGAEPEVAPPTKPGALPEPVRGPLAPTGAERPSPVAAKPRNAAEAKDRVNLQWAEMTAAQMKPGEERWFPPQVTRIFQFRGKERSGLAITGDVLRRAGLEPVPGKVNDWRKPPAPEVVKGLPTVKAKGPEPSKVAQPPKPIKAAKPRAPAPMPAKPKTEAPVAAKPPAPPKKPPTPPEAPAAAAPEPEKRAAAEVLAERAKTKLALSQLRSLRARDASHAETRAAFKAIVKRIPMRPRGRAFSGPWPETPEAYIHALEQAEKYLERHLKNRPLARIKRARKYLKKHRMEMAPPLRAQADELIVQVPKGKIRPMLDRGLDALDVLANKFEETAFLHKSEGALVASNRHTNRVVAGRGLLEEMAASVGSPTVETPEGQQASTRELRGLRRLGRTALVKPDSLIERWLGDEEGVAHYYFVDQIDAGNRVACRRIVAAEDNVARAAEKLPGGSIDSEEFYKWWHEPLTFKLPTLGTVTVEPIRARQVAEPVGPR